MPGNTGSTSGAMVVSVSEAGVVGLKEFRKALRAIGPEWPKELRIVHKELAVKAAGWAQDEARSMGGVQAKAAGAIRGKASQRDARIGVLANKANAMANVAFWGAEKRTGWYARHRYSNSPAPQHPSWVGNTWDVAVAGTGPYAINTALAHHQDEIIEEYGQLVERVASRAFPDGAVSTGRGFARSRS